MKVMDSFWYKNIKGHFSFDILVKGLSSIALSKWPTFL